MKYLFVMGLALLVLASIVTALKLPDAQSEVPVIYWVTDANPARLEQVRLFEEWVRNNNYPETRLRLDMANSDQTKKIIQGVSGVAGDVMDMGSGGAMRYFRAIGLNTDVTEAAKELKFDMSQTYPALLPELTLEEDGQIRQYQFPCNVVAPLYFVNRGTFRMHNQPLPPMRWTIEEFESRGKAFVEAANAGQSRQTVFFADTVPYDIVRASLGGSRFNETGTASALNDRPNREAWRLYYKWMFMDHLIPTASDRASFTTESGYGGATAQLFVSENPRRGQYAMMFTGRYLLIEFRKPGTPELDLGVAEPPHGGFPNTSIGTRAAMVYAGSPNIDRAKLFLAYLASEEYNMQIVRDGDSLPPNPKYTELEEYKRPRDFPNEWDVHEPFADAAMTLAIGTSYSPFILHGTADRIEADARDQYINRLISLDEACRMAENEMNAEMMRNIAENPRLRPLYERLLKQQKQIDALKTRINDYLKTSPEGAAIPDEMKIPMDLLENPFHRAYYQFKGWTK